MSKFNNQEQPHESKSASDADEMATLPSIPRGQAFYKFNTSETTPSPKFKELVVGMARQRRERILNHFDRLAETKGSLDVAFMHGDDSEFFRTESALYKDILYIAAAQNVRILQDNMAPILSQDITAPGLLDSWSEAYDGARHYLYSISCREVFARDRSQGSDALIELEAFEKLYGPDRRTYLYTAMLFYSRTENRSEYDKLCTLLGFPLEYNDRGQYTEDCVERIMDFDPSTLEHLQLPQDQFLKQFSIHLQALVTSLDTCPKMKEGLAKSKFGEIRDRLEEILS